HRVAVGHHEGRLDAEPGVLERGDDERPGGVLVDAGCRSVRGHHDRRPHAGTSLRDQSPLLPPDFDSTRTSVIVAALSTALTMSTTVRAATETAVSASISTPVRSAVRTVAVMVTASSSTSRS